MSRDIGAVLQQYVNDNKNSIMILAATNPSVAIPDVSARVVQIIVAARWATLHWRIFLKLANNTYIWLNMVNNTDSGDEYDGWMSIECRPPGEKSPEVMVAVDLTSGGGPGGWTVKYILDEIVYHKPHSLTWFRFAKQTAGLEGVTRGCRFWCYVVIGELAKAGIVAHGAREHVEQRFRELSEDGTKFDLEAIPGTFLDKMPSPHKT